MIFLFIVVVVRSRVAIFFFRIVFRQIISFILYVVPHGLAGIVFIAFFVIVLIVVFFFGSTADLVGSSETGSAPTRALPTPHGGLVGAPLKGVWTKVADSGVKGSAFCCRCA